MHLTVFGYDEYVGGGRKQVRGQVRSFAMAMGRALVCVALRQVELGCLDLSSVDMLAAHRAGEALDECRLILPTKGGARRRR